MISIWTRSGFMLACIAIPAAATFGQQTIVQPLYQLPVESMTPQHNPERAPPTDQHEPAQQAPVTTHGLNFEPEAPAEPDKPLSGTTDTDQKIETELPTESDQRGRPSPRPQHSEPPPIDTNAELLVRALDWLLEERVELINMSLAGPANRLLQHAVETAVESGVLIVSAAGNGNPAFPAAYPGVVAVTAVDSRGRVYRQANRGDYVDFAAPGVDVFLAAPYNRGKYYSGTSFATPFVTAALAVLISRHPEAGSDALLRQLSNTARDLGDPGRDPTFGWGLVQVPADCTSLAARE